MSARPTAIPRSSSTESPDSYNHHPTNLSRSASVIATGGRRQVAHFGDVPAIRCAYSRRTDNANAAPQSAHATSMDGPTRSATTLELRLFPQELAHGIGSRCGPGDSFRDHGQAAATISMMAVCARAQRHSGLVLDLAAFEDRLRDSLLGLSALLHSVEARQKLGHGLKHRLLRRHSCIHSSPMRTTLTEPKVVISAQVPIDQRDELERIARDQDRTISYLVRQAVDRYLHEPAIRTED